MTDSMMAAYLLEEQEREDDLALVDAEAFAARHGGCTCTAATGCTGHPDGLQLREDGGGPVLSTCPWCLGLGAYSHCPILGFGCCEDGWRPECEDPLCEAASRRGDLP